MNSILTSLKMIPIEHIRYHERIDPFRIERVCTAIKQDGVLRNPPLVTLISNDFYLLLDGAHRVQALRSLGYRQVLVQVVKETSFTLDMWHHMLPSADWLEELESDKRLCITDICQCDQTAIAEILFGDGHQKFVYTNGNSNDWNDYLQAWHRLVGTYSEWYSVQRHPSSQSLELKTDEVLVKFPPLSHDQLQQIILAGQLLPPGVTHMQVQGRLLNLQLPLSLLKESELDATSWRELLQSWDSLIRYYNEPVFVLEA